jgi:hypothetical protein
MDTVRIDTGPTPTTGRVTATRTTEPRPARQARGLRTQPSGSPTRAGTSSDRMALTMWRTVAPVITMADINTVGPTGDRTQLWPQAPSPTVPSPRGNGLAAGVLDDNRWAAGDRDVG